MHLQRLLAGWRRDGKQVKDPAVEHQIVVTVR